jgi:hypothetical protein
MQNSVLARKQSPEIKRIFAISSFQGHVARGPWPPAAVGAVLAGDGIDDPEAGAARRFVAASADEVFELLDKVVIFPALRFVP